MKRGLFFLGFSVVITLTIVLTTRVSADALAVIVGLLLGILASLPATLLLIFVMTRQQNKVERPLNQLPQHPPVVVVNASEKSSGYSAAPALPAPQGINGRRQWTIIGDQETDN